jgi:hypothetical protein
MARNGSVRSRRKCLLLGVEQTWLASAATSEFDPFQTLRTAAMLRRSDIAELFSVSFGNPPKFRRTFAQCSAPWQIQNVDPLSNLQGDCEQTTSLVSA